MNLLEIRQWLVKTTGRYDLVSNGPIGDWSDNGANMVINSGSQLLDSKLGIDASVAKRTFLLEAGEFSIPINNVRIIRRVFCYNDTARWEVSKKDLLEFMNLFPGIPSSGVPTYFTLETTRFNDSTGSNFLDSGSDVLTERVIMFNQKADQDYTIKVLGEFSADSLSDDTDENYWSVLYPELLVWASAYVLEVLKRNRSGATDWLTAITDRLMDISYEDSQEQSEFDMRISDV